MKFVITAHTPLGVFKSPELDMSEEEIGESADDLYRIAKDGGVYRWSSKGNITILADGVVSNSVFSIDAVEK